MPGDFDVQRYLDAWNTHQVDRLLEFYADDIELVNASDGTSLRGKEKLRQSIEAAIRAFPDVNGDVASAAVGERDVAVLTHISGTNTGPFAPPPPGSPHPASGKRATWMLASFFTLDDERRIRRQIDVMDMAEFQRQLSGAEEEATMPPATYGVETGP